MPKLDPVPYDGRIPTGHRLRRDVERLLMDRKHPADAVIALTDVYTGTDPREFQDAADAKEKMRSWAGASDRFFPHAAQHDFEAWLLPYWGWQGSAGLGPRLPRAEVAAEHDPQALRGGRDSVSGQAAAVATKTAYFPGISGFQTEHKKHYRTLEGARNARENRLIAARTSRAGGVRPASDPWDPLDPYFDTLTQA
jgi:hypothetical protein